MTKLLQKYSPSDIEALKEAFDREGYCILRGLFEAGEVEELRKHFHAMRDEGVPGKYKPIGLEEANGDILRAYPRITHPHRWDATSRRYMVDNRLTSVLAALAGEAVYAVQSMFYFKPPGGRGQSMHQDQFYLQVKPGTCLAAWAALDYCDRENGAIMLAPGTQDDPINCRNVGKVGSYEGGPGIPVPEGRELVTADMEPGDVLFFNGSVVHGSTRNASEDRWRRSFICHYVGQSTERISQSYLPVVTENGEDMYIAATNDGGDCGGYVATVNAAS